LRTQNLGLQVSWECQKSRNTRNKKASLIYIKERVWSKFQGWKEKLLLQVGREILLKAVVQAIPTFSISCFKLPVGLCNEIESLIRKFCWGQIGEQRKIHWKKKGKLFANQKQREGWDLRIW